MSVDSGGILDLPDEFLSNALRYIGEDHAFPVALTCRAFAQEAGRNARNDARRCSELPFDAADPANLYRTPVRTIVNTVELCAWARDTGCPWNTSICALAAAAGNFEVLQWARLNGCPWDWRTYEWAAEYPNIQQWADESGCPWKIVFPDGTPRGNVVRVSAVGEALNLFNASISSIPPEIEHLVALKELNLYKNKIAIIPLEIAQLRNLRGLWLNNNEITTIPSEIAQLTNLTELYLDGNKITTIPPEITQLRNLTVLGLRQNRIATLPSEISQMTRLRELDLLWNPVHSLPDGLRSALPQLTIRGAGL